jgi:hypothetical protein
VDGRANCSFGRWFAELVLWQRHLVVVAESGLSASNLKTAAVARAASTFSFIF